MEDMGRLVPNFWRGKRVLVTGHTGFKGSWLTQWLLMKGAKVTGFALPPEKGSLFELLNLEKQVVNYFLDLNKADLSSVIGASSPQLIFHLAAQALVSRSIKSPIDTWLTNVIGSARLYQSCAFIGNRCVMVSITSDKVYEDNPNQAPYDETHPLGGSDPYSASKAANEILLNSWRDTFFNDANCLVASARSGNVIGGGDFAQDRIFPDMYRAYKDNSPLRLRNPHHVRPWQHVLDPLNGYLILAQSLYENGAAELCSPFNFGPSEQQLRDVETLALRVSERWGLSPTVCENKNANHETSLLSLSSAKAQRLIGWSPKWNFERSVDETINWYEAYVSGCEVSDCTSRQIERFENS